MAYVPVPKDLTKVKSKFLFNLTKRQVVCFGLGALVGVPVFFLTKGIIGVSMAAACGSTSPVMEAKPFPSDRKERISSSERPDIPWWYVDAATASGKRMA